MEGYFQVHLSNAWFVTLDLCNDPFWVCFKVSCQYCDEFDFFFGKALQYSLFYQSTSNLNCSCKQSDLPSKISNSYKLLTNIRNGRSQTPNNLKFGRFVLIFKKSLIYNQVFYIYFVPFSLREKKIKKNCLSLWPVISLRTIYLFVLEHGIYVPWGLNQIYI